MSILSEQKLFKPSELREHLREGDYDNEGNLYFLHPFCRVKFFFLEIFLRKIFLLLRKIFLLKFQGIFSLQYSPI